MYLNALTLNPAARQCKSALSIHPRRFCALLALGCCLLLAASDSSAQANNTIGTVAGPPPFTTNALLADLPNPTGIAEDASGNIYIASQYSYYVYKLNPTTGTLSVIAGTGIFGFGKDGVATNSALSSAVAVAVDKSANVYIMDGNRIRVVNTQPSANITVLGVLISPGNIATVAGQVPSCQNPTQVSTRSSPSSVASGPCGDGGPAAKASFTFPQAIYLDGAGNLFIADTTGERIRFINTATNSISVAGQLVPGGVVATLAGNGWTCNQPSNVCGDGGPAIASGEQLGVGAKLDLPQGVVTDSAGNIYIGDTRDQRIRCVVNVPGGCPQSAFPNTQVGEIVTYAGAGAPFCTDPTNNSCNNNTKNSDKLNALFHNPAGVWLDSVGNLYVADQWDNQIRQVTPGASGMVGTFCGDGNANFGSGTCPAGVEFYGPLAVILDSAGSMTVADSGNSLIRQWPVATGLVNTIAGTMSVGDGDPATSAFLANPVDVKWDLTGSNYYIVDNGNNRIREVNATTGIISTVAGTGHPSQWCTEPPPLSCNGDYGAATSATLDNPNGIALDAAGNLYIADSTNSAVRAVNMQQSGNLVVGSVVIPPGEIATVAGVMGVECFGGPCGDGGPATAANVDYPISVTVDLSGNIYIADYYLGKVRCAVIAAGGCPNSNNPGSPVGTIVSVAGLNGGSGWNGDTLGNGQPRNADTAKLFHPYGLGTLSGGLVFDDSGNNEVRCVALADNGCGPGTKVQDIYDYALNHSNTGPCAGDGGAATAATEGVPQGLGFDPAGNLYFGGGGNLVVRRVDATTQNIMTVAGACNNQSGAPGFGGDGGPATSATLDNIGLSVNSTEYLLIADQGNNRVRQVDMVPVIAMFQKKLDFGSVQDGTTSSTLYATMQNYGLASLPIIGTPTITGTDQQFFTIVSNTCVNQLPPGPAQGSGKSTCSVGVQFTPQAPPGSYNAALNINTSLGQQVVNLIGVGTN